MNQQTNIFKDAKFGDRFVTADARILIYHCPTTKGGKPLIVHQLIEEFNIDIIICDESGKCINMSDYRTDIDTDTVHFHYNQYDVIEKYTETIDEKELNKLAIECTPRLMIEENDGDNDFQWGFKVGYRKAKEK